MTTGPIMRKVFLFAIPIIISNILQQLYTTVDTLVIGNFCGRTSLAAVGTSAQPVEVLLCLFLGIGGGVSILISQYIGANDTKAIQRTCQTAVFFVYLCGIPLSVLGYIVTPAILHMMGVPQDTMEIATIYTRIVFLGTLANVGYNMNAGILRGIGDSKASLYCLIISCTVNIIFDILLVPVLGLEAGGAALATIIAQYVSWIASIIYIKKNFTNIGFTMLPRKCSANELKKIVGFGLPIGLNNSLFSLGHMFMQVMVNAQGSIFMAGASIAGRITGIANIAITALSQAGATYSGQNYGAKNIARLRQGYIKIPVISGLVTLISGLIFISIRMPVLRFFNHDEMVLMYASRYVVVQLLSSWMYAVYNGITSIVNGTGRLKYTTIVNLMMLWAVRIPGAYIIMKCFDGTWIMLSVSMSFLFGMLAMISYYLFSKDWKRFISY